MYNFTQLLGVNQRVMTASLENGKVRPLHTQRTYTYPCMYAYMYARVQAGTVCNVFHVRTYLYACVAVYATYIHLHSTCNARTHCMYGAYICEKTFVEALLCYTRWRESLYRTVNE